MVSPTPTGVASSTPAVHRRGVAAALLVRSVASEPASAKYKYYCLNPASSRRVAPGAPRGDCNAVGAWPALPAGDDSPSRPSPRVAATPAPGTDRRVKSDDGLALGVRGPTRSRQLAATWRRGRPACTVLKRTVLYCTGMYWNVLDLGRHRTHSLSPGK